MSLLNTSHPQALQHFLTETLFDVGMDPAASPEPIVSAPASQLTEIPYYGGNAKNILFIVSDKDGLFFSEQAELAFLKTMQALKLELKDIAVLNLHLLEQPVIFENIRVKFEPQSCIFLGAEPAEAGLEAFANHLWKDEGGVRFLKSFSFEEMLSDNQKKRMFWDAIKLIDLS